MPKTQGQTREFVFTYSLFLLNNQLYIIMYGRKYFLNVTKGQFLENEKTETRNSFTELTGHLVNITFKETPYGEAMRLHVVDENNFYMLSIFTHSRAANAFFMIVQNLELNHEATFKIHAEDGKNYFSIHQFGGPILWFYTAENAHDLPNEPEQRRAFLVDLIKNNIAPQLQKKINPYPNHSLYKPARQGLQGGYFDGMNAPTKRLNPISRFERQDRKRPGGASNIPL